MHRRMRAELWRDGSYVGFLVVATTGRVTEDFTPAERERIVPIVRRIEERLSDPASWPHSSDAPEGLPTPGDSEWFPRFLAELRSEGYEHRLLEDDGYGRG